MKVALIPGYDPPGREETKDLGNDGKIRVFLNGAMTEYLEMFVNTEYRGIVVRPSYCRDIGAFPLVSNERLALLISAVSRR